MNPLAPQRRTQEVQLGGPNPSDEYTTRLNGAISSSLAMNAGARAPR
ncbi:hypothetical protein I553_6358 [Mycobacterium xenopi 4042]|uniref:Uncharacterized protein n=1 Tax=Mycobacterium xenopi 4042 TaxID=1299334 RepID=X8BGX4_MYCXE|nr:hypothetical protein I552_6419 [Mycobacterium xenopi 3993]EUA42498.1 hypothetical protein I553_6358 [Mycobacterium xenopi 4042]